MIYAESFAPLLDFGWSPLRSVREGPGNTSPRRGLSCTKLREIPARRLICESQDPQRAARLRARVEAFSGIEPALAQRPTAMPLAACDRSAIWVERQRRPRARRARIQRIASKSRLALPK